jgi:hypothetical protein
MMLIGVMSYSFAISSVNSVLSALDERQAALRNKLSILEDLKREYKLSHEMYMRLKKALKYDHSRNVADKFTFLNELPQSLKIELSKIMHEKIITRIPFFQGRSPHFMAFIGPMLRPTKVMKGEYIYVEGEPIDESKFFFLNSQ